MNAVDFPARVLANLGGETGEKAIGAYKEGICMMKYNEIAIRDMEKVEIIR